MANDRYLRHLFLTTVLVLAGICLRADQGGGRRRYPCISLVNRVRVGGDALTRVVRKEVGD